MSADQATTPGRRQSIITARVNRARRELVDAIVEATKQSDLTRDTAQGKLSSMICELWNEAERKIRSIPLREPEQFD